MKLVTPNPSFRFASEQAKTANLLRNRLNTRVIVLCFAGLLDWAAAVDAGEPEPPKMITISSAESGAFGSSLGLSGEFLIVGAPLDSGNGAEAGAAYIFQRQSQDQGQWIQIVKLQPADAGPDASFGYSVAIDGDTAVVGAPASLSIDKAGAVYVFHRDQDGENAWGQVSRFAAQNANALDEFGRAVAIDGDVLVVGVPGDDFADFGFPDKDSGAVYVYQRTSSERQDWELSRKIDIFFSRALGKAVDIHGDLIVASADRAVHAFRRDSLRGTWAKVSTLTNNAAGLSFGRAVAAADAAIIVGAGSGIGGFPSSSDAVLGYKPSEPGGPNWSLACQLSAAELKTRGLGASVSTDGRWFMVGAPLHDEIFGSGAVFIFEISSSASTDCRLLYRLEANKIVPAPGFGLGFGHAVAIDRAYAAVGTPGDRNEVYVFELLQPGPLLSITPCPEGECVLLSWNAEDSEVVVESVLDLQASEWSVLAERPVSPLKVPVGSKNQFFRLRAR